MATNNSPAQIVASKHHSSPRGTREKWKTLSLGQQSYKVGLENLTLGRKEWSKPFRVMSKEFRNQPQEAPTGQRWKMIVAKDIKCNTLKHIKSISDYEWFQKNKNGKLIGYFQRMLENLLHLKPGKGNKIFIIYLLPQGNQIVDMYISILNFILEMKEEKERDMERKSTDWKKLKKMYQSTVMCDPDLDLDSNEKTIM